MKNIILVLTVVLTVLMLYNCMQTEDKSEPYELGSLTDTCRERLACSCVSCDSPAVPLFRAPGVPYDQLAPGRLTPRTELAFFPPLVPLDSFDMVGRY